ncbi:hypothetical protein GCM10012280_05450 [Wenjunlia tyrosinilytica]|uniref:Uncharacterized protein n=1 Tax=Wenjunlia tyrosinilytica TaxID=1544741 RepID=A0A917ZEJ6_9ACTN|nr:hypothetical protein GCM10012280_05450 [Wenjunlia tyrosinilytica]
MWSDTAVPTGDNWWARPFPRPSLLPARAAAWARYVFGKWAVARTEPSAASRRAPERSEGFECEGAAQ